jgi:hypothetical protein
MEINELNEWTKTDSGGKQLPLNERTRGQKIAMIAGWFVIISVLILLW